MPGRRQLFSMDFDGEIIDPTCRECGCSFTGNLQDYNVTWICDKCTQRKAEEPPKAPLDTSKDQAKLVKEHIQNLAKQPKRKSAVVVVKKNKQKKETEFSCPPPLKTPIAIKNKKSDDNNPLEAVKTNDHTSEQPQTNNRRSGYNTSHTRSMCFRRR